MNAEGHEDITKRSKTPGVGSYTIKRLYPGGQKYTMRGIHNVNNDSFENISPGPAAYNPIRVNKIISYKFEGKKMKNLLIIIILVLENILFYIVIKLF